MRVLGVDPGLTRCGVGVVDGSIGRPLTLVDVGVVRTTADLVRFGCGLRIDCLGCGASRTVDGLEIARAVGSVDLIVLERRLRCERCQTKDARLTKLPPPPSR